MEIDDFDSDISDFQNEVYNAQEQWDHNMKELQTVVFALLFPVVGKILGRRFAQRVWSWFVMYRWNGAKARME